MDRMEIIKGRTYENLLAISEPWLQYAIRVHLLHESRADLLELRSEALNDKKIQSYLADMANFHNAMESTVTLSNTHPCYVYLTCMRHQDMHI